MERREWNGIELCVWFVHVCANRTRRQHPIDKHKRLICSSFHKSRYFMCIGHTHRRAVAHSLTTTHTHANARAKHFFDLQTHTVMRARDTNCCLRKKTSQTTNITHSMKENKRPIEAMGDYVRAQKREISNCCEFHVLQNTIKTIVQWLSFFAKTLTLNSESCGVAANGSRIKSVSLNGCAKW